MKVPGDTVMGATADDCHHGGCTEWGVLNDVLYTRRNHLMYPCDWDKVSRVSYTPKRMRLIAELINEAALEAVMVELR